MSRDRQQRRPSGHEGSDPTPPAGGVLSAAGGHRGPGRDGCRGRGRVRRLWRGLHPVRPDRPRCRPAERHAQRERRVRARRGHRRAARRRDTAPGRRGRRAARRALPGPCDRSARQRRSATPHAAEVRGDEGRAVRRAGVPPRPAGRRSDRVDPPAQADDPADRRAASPIVVNGEHREDRVDSVILNRERIEWIAVVEPDRAAVPVRDRSARDPDDPRRPDRATPPEAPEAPAPRRARGATIGRDARPIRPARPPARSPASASSTARRSSPGRTARCCSATSGPRSSRSSHPRATRRAAGARRGSARSRPGTRTAAYFLAVNRNKRGLRLDLKTADGAAILRRLLADADVLVENFRGDGFARLGFDDEALAHAQPAARPSRDLRVRDERPGGRATRLRLHRPGGERADVDHRRRRRRRRRADQGRGRDQRHPDRDARCGRAARRARRSRARGRARFRPGPAGRRLDPRRDAGEPRQPGPERVRVGSRTGPARQRPSEHRPVRDLRHGRRRARGRRRVGAAVAPSLRGARAA